MSIRYEGIDVENFINRLERLGWVNGKDYLKKYGIVFQEGDLVSFYFDNVLKDFIRRINYDIFANLSAEEEEEALREVLDRFHGDREVSVLNYLKYGVEVYLRKRKRKVSIRLIDYDRPENNVFFYLREAKFRGSPENVKPDVTLYVNGIPIVIVEVKRFIETYSYLVAVEQIRRYEKYSPELFKYVQFAIAVGDEERYTPTLPNWDRAERDLPVYRWVVKDKDSSGGIIERFDVSYILEHKRLLEFIKYFVFYRRSREGFVDKIVARYNQYYAAKKAIARIDSYMSGKEKNKGLIWHWLGSGKTYTMFFIANYFLDKYWHKRPVVFFVVDRRDLEEQHERMLKSIEESKFKTLFKKIEKIEELHHQISIMKESELYGGTIAYGVYLTTIQKFRRGACEPSSEEKELTRGLLDLLRELGEQYLEYLKAENLKEYENHIKALNRLDERGRLEYLVRLGQVRSRNILLLIDEAHRTQYGILAAMRKTVFPNALAFGFTGTPVFKLERNTFMEFAYPHEGEYYLDVYFIRDSIRDGFTLPMVYHAVGEGEVSSEGIKIKLSEEEIKEFIEEYMRAREKGIDVTDHLDTMYKQVSKYINKIRVFLMNPRRIDSLAKYIVDRLEEDTERFRFKAMVVAVNRVACVRYKRALEKYLMIKYGERAKDWVEVVMTYNYNDTDREILEYREELVKKYGKSDMDEINREIERKFLEEESPRILIVTDMLITGFDAPMLKVMYLDKPLYEHRLLQAIARVNRPYKDKNFGLIVDSIGLLEHLSKTLALYSLLAEEDIRRDFEENLLKRIEEKVEEFEELFKSVKDRLKRLRLRGEDVSIDLDEIKKQLKERSFDREEFERRIGIIALYVSSQISSEEVTYIKKLVNDMRRTIRLYRSLGAHPKKLFYVEDIQVLYFIYGSILKEIRRGRIRLDKGFWRELTELIYSKTIIDEFNKIAEGEINVEIIEGIARTTRPKRDIQRIVADYYFYLRNTLISNLHDPIYREILKRLEELRRQWILRKIDLKMFLAGLKALGIQKREYDERIKGKSLEDRICESITTYISTSILSNKAIHLRLNEMRKALKKLVKSKKMGIIKPSDKKRLVKSLLADLISELKNVRPPDELAKLADKLVEEFIVPEISEKVKSDEQAFKDAD